jgi:DNA (cytosine-5)-methyltransferase 1
MLRVGTDCSGIEAPIEALRQLNIPFKHVFSSEIDKYCIKSIKANYNPNIIFGDKDGPYPEGDIRKRDMNNVPDIDLYVCGFPCQPFSTAGGRKGLEDTRGNVFFSCLEVIKVKEPKYFILENVKGLLLHDKGKTWNIIWTHILELKEYGYNVDWKILNTKDYGIPQNRERLFIIGTKSKDNFEWPDKTIMDNLENYIDWNDNNKQETKRKNYSKIKNEWLFVDFNFLNLNSGINSGKFSPCLNTNSGLWCVQKHRYANIKEYLMLQGFCINFNQTISDTQMKKQIGNSMSVNVLKKIIKNLL